MKKNTWIFSSVLNAICLISLGVFLVGCNPHKINPNPSPNITSLPTYSHHSEKSLPKRSWINDWNDPTLSSLIVQSLAGNFDLRQSLARLAQADEIAQESKITRRPNIEISGEKRQTFDHETNNEGSSDIGVSLTWELDAFGRLSALSQSDNYDLKAAMEDVEALRLTIAAHVAENYFSAVAQQAYLKLLSEQSELDQKYLNLVTARAEAGVGTNVEVLQQKSQYSLTRSLVPSTEADLRAFENRLDVLIGAMPDGVNRTKENITLPLLHDMPAVGIPSDLLLNRPDLRSLKNQLIAADADIGAAIAGRLPRLTLDGSYFYADGPGAAGPIGLILGSFVQPLLDWGRHQSVVERNKALYEEKLAIFTQNYLSAVEEVENALYRENRQREFLLRLQQRQKILSQTVTAAQEVYQQGVSDYFPVIDALKDLQDIERTMITETLNLVLLRVELYRAAGLPIDISSETYQ